MKPFISAIPNRINAFLPVWLYGRTGIWVLSAILYTGIYTSWIFFKWADPAYEDLIAGLGYLPLGLFCVISAFYMSRRKEIEPQICKAWRIIAISILFLSVGDIIFVTLELTRGIGFPDIPDFFYIAFYPLAFIGFISFPTRIVDSSQKKTWLLDLAGTSISITAIFWYFIIAPTGEAGGEDWFARIVAGAYPAMDMLLITSLVIQLFRKSDGNTRQTLILLGFGMFAYIIADIAYAAQLLQNEYFSGSWVDALWTLSYLLMGVAAIRQPATASPELEPGNEPDNSWQASLLPLGTAVLSVIISIYASNNGTHSPLQINGLITGAILSSLLIVGRQVITIRENSILIQSLKLATDRLQLNAETLEERVNDRTREITHQSNQFRLISEITQNFIPATNLQDLLDRSTQGIKQGFNLTYTAVYLLDGAMETARLIASSTEAERQSVRDRSTIKIRDVGLFSRVITTGQPLHSITSQSDSLQLKQIWLPDTQSAITLPLKTGSRISGILDVQSNMADAFQKDEIKILQILSDQLASAIERTQLAEKVDQTLQELERSSSLTTRTGWRNLANSDRLRHRGYRFDNIRIEPVTTLSGLAREVLNTGNVLNENGKGESHEIAIPIKLRGQTIGVVQASIKEGASENTVETLQLAIDRLASALESARLYEQASLRADREQAISQITNAISSSSEYETIMRTTVRELGNILNDTEVAIQFVTDLDNRNAG